MSSHPAENDLSDQELAHINHRLGRTLERYAVLPFHALLYRMGETGSKRVEEKALRRALRELAGNRRPRRGRVGGTGPHQPRELLYVRGDISAEEAALASEQAAPRISEFASYLALGSVEELSRTIEEAIPTDGSEFIGQPDKVTIAPHAHLETGARAIRAALKTPHSKVRLLISHTPRWLYPDDAVFWQFLSLCHSEGARPLIFARAIAPGMFPLLKAIGAIGVQYYSTLVPSGAHARASELRDELGWCHIRAIDANALEMPLQRVRDAIINLGSQPTDPEVSAALARIRGTGLEVTPTIQSVLRWWQQSGLQLPSPVSRGWSRWVGWDAYRRNGRKPVRAEVAADPLVGAAASPTVESAIENEPPGESQIIRLGLPLPRREVNAILAMRKERDERTR